MLWPKREAEMGTTGRKGSKTLVEKVEIENSEKITLFKAERCLERG